MKLLIGNPLWAICISIITAFVASAPSFGADSPSESFSAGLLFRPLRANTFEPRVGAAYLTESERLRLDIGNSIDLAAARLSQRAEARFGADFFTYTRLRSEENFRFPVETTDFFFGINGSIRLPTSSELAFASRLRVAHISSHLVDGTPRFTDSAFVYSREFVDAVFALEWKVWRVYAGVNVLFHSIPNVFGTVTPQIGADMIEYSWLGDRAAVCAGFDLKMVTIDGVTNSVQTAEGGIRFGAKYGTGFFAGVLWMNGKSIHGMYYNRYDKYVGVGFRLEF